MWQQLFGILSIMNLPDTPYQFIMVFVAVDQAKNLKTPFPESGDVRYTSVSQEDFLCAKRRGLSLLAGSMRRGVLLQ
jgi:hypothetical protein